MLVAQLSVTHSLSVIVVLLVVKEIDGAEVGGTAVGGKVGRRAAVGGMMIRVGKVVGRFVGVGVSGVAEADSVMVETNAIVVAVG